MASRRNVQANITLSIDGSKRVQSEIGKLFDVVRDATKEVDTFDKKGGLGRLAVGSDRIRKAQSDIASLSLDLQKAQADAEKTRSKLEAVRFVANDDYRLQLSQELVDAERRANDAADAIARIPVELRESNRAAVGFLGDIDTAFQTFSGAVGGLGRSVSGSIGGLAIRGGLGGGGGVLGAVGGGLAGVGDIFAVAEQVPILSSALGTLNQRVREGIKDSGGLKNSIVDLFKNTGSTTKVIGLATAGMLALEIATSAVNKANRERAERTRQEAKEAGREIELRQLSADELRDLIEQRQKDIEVARAQRGVFEQRLSSELGYLEASRKAYEAIPALGSIFGEAELTETERDLNKTKDSIKDMRSEVNQARGALEEIEEVERRRRYELEQQAIAAERLLSISGRAQDEIQQRLNERQLLTQGSEAILSEIADLQARTRVTTDVVLGNFGDFLTEFQEQNELFVINTKTILEQRLGRDLDLTNLDDISLLLSEIEQFSRDTDLNVIQLTDAQRQAIDEFQGLIESTDTMTQSANRLSNETLNAARSAESYQNALSDLAAQEEEVSRIAQERTGIVSNLKNAQQDYSDFLKNRATEDAREASRNSQISALQRRIDAAKAQEDTARQQAKARDIVRDGQQKQSEIQQKFVRDQYKDLRKFQEDQAKAVKDHNKRLSEIDRQRNEDQFQAALDNDVNAFIAAQRTADEQTRQENDQFQERLNGLRDTFAKEQQQRQESLQRELQQNQQAINAKLQQEQQAAQQSISLSQRLQNQLAQLRQKFAQEDALRQRQAQEQVHKERINQLKNELQAINILNRAAFDVQRNLAAGAGIRVTRAVPRSGEDSLVGRRFANEGIVRGGKPIIGMIGDVPRGESEAIIRFKDSEGLPRSLANRGISGGRPPIYINVDMTVGDVATGQRLTSELNQLEDRIDESVTSAFAQIFRIQGA